MLIDKGVPDALLLLFGKTVVAPHVKGLQVCLSLQDSQQWRDATFPPIFEPGRLVSNCESADSVDIAVGEVVQELVAFFSDASRVLQVQGLEA